MTDTLTLAQHYLTIQQPHKALEHLSKHPHVEDAEYWRLLGRTHYLLNHDSEAEKAFMEGLRLEPDNTALRYGLVLNHYWSGRYAAALKDTEYLLAQEAENAIYLSRKALILGQQNNYAEAALYLKRAQDIDPEHPFIQETAMLLRYWEDLAANKIVGLTEKPHETIQHAKTILQQHPDNAFAHYVLGKSLMKQGGQKRIHQALQHFAQAASLSPDDVRYTKTLREHRWFIMPLFRYAPTAQHLPSRLLSVLLVSLVGLMLSLNSTRQWLPGFAFTTLLVLQNLLLVYLVVYSGVVPLFIINYQDIRYRGLLPWLKETYKKWRDA